VVPETVAVREAREEKLSVVLRGGGTGDPGGIGKGGGGGKGIINFIELFEQFLLHVLSSMIVILNNDSFPGSVRGSNLIIQI